MASQRTGGMVLHVYAEWSAGRRTMPDFGHGWGASVLVPWPEKIKRLQRLLIGEVGPAPLCIFEMHSGGVVPGTEGTFLVPGAWGGKAGHGSSRANDAPGATKEAARPVSPKI